MSLKATITDSEALRAITPEMLMNYLSAHYRNSPLPPADILVPTRGSVDYAHRMWDAVNALARIEDRSQLDIYCELIGKPTYEELERELDALRHQLSYGY